MSTSSTESYEKLLATAELSEAERYDLLSSKRRRTVCHILGDRETPISVEELATEVSAREDATRESNTRSDVKIALHHIHLPKLATAGVIDYDHETRQIECTSASLEPLAE